MNSLKKTTGDAGRGKAERRVFLECLAEKKKRRKYLADLQLSEKITILETLRKNATHIKTGLANTGY